MNDNRFENENTPEPSVESGIINETPSIRENNQTQTPVENVMPETLRDEIRKEQANQVQLKKKKHIFRKIFNFLITIALLAWIFMIIYDFYSVQNKN